VCVCVTHRPSEVNEFLSHLDNEVVFGHERTVQALIKLYQLTVHLSHLQHKRYKTHGYVGYVQKKKKKN